MTAQRLRHGEPPSENRSSLSERLILVTARRRENFGAPLVQICNALAVLAKRY